MRQLAYSVVLLLLAGCASASFTMQDIETRVAALLPAQAILLGEQHDAPEHQRIHQRVIESLAGRGALAAVALEMAPQGGSTAGLPRDSTEAVVQAALHWTDTSWSWQAYAPAVMSAVRTGITVLGANLPGTGLRAAMADARLDAMLPGPALAAQQQAIRLGHCGLLPETQIAPMARVQIARDEAMAQSLVQATIPGKTVLLMAGARHVDRSLGVPLHLPAGYQAKSVALRIQPAPDAGEEAAVVDASWPTAAPPPKDYCAELRQHLAPK